MAEEKKEGIYLADYSMEELRAYRSSEMMGNTFRKTGTYRELMNDMIAEPFVRERGKEL